MKEANEAEALVERLLSNMCPENTGCGTVQFCACAGIEEAADTITALLADVARKDAALRHYAKQYCEGWCDGAVEQWSDCGGCLARAALKAEG